MSYSDNAAKISKNLRNSKNSIYFVGNVLFQQPICMPQLSYHFLFSQANILFVHEAYIEPKNAQYHNFLCQYLAIHYIDNYPELFEFKIGQEIVKQIQQASAKQKIKLIDKYIAKKNIHLSDFQHYNIEYTLLALLTKIKDKLFYYCFCPIEFLESNSLVKNIIVENFEIAEILTSWQDDFFFAAPSQRIILKLRKKKLKVDKKEAKKGEKPTEVPQIYFTNVHHFEELDFLHTTIPSLEKFTKTNENIAFYSTATHTTWAVSIDFLLKENNHNWAKYLKMSSLYGDILAKCRYMLTPFKNMATLQAPFAFATTSVYPLIALQQNKKTVTVINNLEKEAEIEKKYLRHVISNVKELVLAQETDEKVGQLVFYCSKSTEELAKLKDDFAINFIKQNTDNQVVEKWYSHKQTPADALLATEIHHGFHWFENTQDYLHTNTILGANWKKEGIKYFLRSSFFDFWIENEIAMLHADGAILSAEKLADMLLINADLLQNEGIKNAYQEVNKRKKLEITEEILQEDTQKLDKLIAEALGLEEDTLPKMYATLQNLYTYRVHHQGTLKKHKNPKNFLKIVKTYLGELQQEQDFSEKDFSNFIATYQTAHALQPSAVYQTEKQPIKVLDFLGNYEVYAGKNLLFTTTSRTQVEFVKLYSLSNKENLQIFDNEDIIEKILGDFKQKLSQKQHFSQTFMQEKFMVLNAKG